MSFHLEWFTFEAERLQNAQHCLFYIDDIHYNYITIRNQRLQLDIDIEDCHRKW